MDLEAMIETIESKNEMEKRKMYTQTKMSQHSLKLSKLQKGQGGLFNFSSKQQKINKITDLNDRLEMGEKEIDCANVLTQIVFLYLQDAAIPFFRQDKLGVYNGAINLYSQKLINNCHKISKFYEKVIGMNQIMDTSRSGGQGQAVGNVTILDEKSYMKSNFVGQFPQQLPPDEPTSPMVMVEE